jgi:hypothetical protein
LDRQCTVGGQLLKVELSETIDYARRFLLSLCLTRT